MDVRAGVVVGMTLLWIRPWTLVLAAAAVGVAWWLERLGLNPPGAVRAMRSYLAGKNRPALPFHKIREPVDFGRRRMAWERPAPEGDHHIEPIKHK